MTNTRALETKIQAWRSFRGISRAARTLAAAQSLRWAGHVRLAARHLAWAQALCEHLGESPDERPLRVLLALGTDVGLCGRINTAVASVARTAIAGTHPALSLVAGARLIDELWDAPGTIDVPGPASLEAAQRFAAETLTLLEGVRPVRAVELTIVLAAATTNDGAPVVRQWIEVPAHLPELGATRHELRGPVRDLTPAVLARDAVLRLRLQARIVHAVCTAGASESAARLFTMSRAYEASERKLAEQELHLRKIRQEAITQDMLEVRLAAAPSGPA